MKTLAERHFERTGHLRRPTEFLPNGCGPAAGGRLSALLVPDEMAGVDYSSCCDEHDLSYYCGGFLGIFYRKPRADVGLGACLTQNFYRAARARWRRGTWAGRAKAVGTAALGTVLGPAYTAAVLLFGWTPLTWAWRKRSIPKSRQFRRVKWALEGQA